MISRIKIHDAELRQRFEVVGFLGQNSLKILFRQIIFILELRELNQDLSKPKVSANRIGCQLKSMFEVLLRSLGLT
jgi:hypothetical protein